MRQNPIPEIQSGLMEDNLLEAFYLDLIVLKVVFLNLSEFANKEYFLKFFIFLNCV